MKNALRKTLARNLLFAGVGALLVAFWGVYAGLTYGWVPVTAYGPSHVTPESAVILVLFGVLSLLVAVKVKPQPVVA